MVVLIQKYIIEYHIEQLAGLLAGVVDITDHGMMILLQFDKNVFRLKELIFILLLSVVGKLTPQKVTR